jgi:hypothetical protein
MWDLFISRKKTVIIPQFPVSFVPCNTDTVCLLLEYHAVKPAHNETTGTEFLSVAGRFLLIQVLEFKLKIVGTLKVFTEDRILFYPSSI